MRIAFVGAVDFSRHCLERILEVGGEVAVVITLTPNKRHLHSDFADLCSLAGQHGIPCHQVNNINDEDTLRLLISYSPDMLFVFGWSQLIGKRVMEVPRLGCIGTHPALLPRNRGRHPLIWALVEGLSESGLTFFYLDEGADSGDILWQGRFPIALDDDAQSLYEKVKHLASLAIGEFLPQLALGTAPRAPQDHSKASYWRKRTANDGLIDWAAPTLRIYNLIRALTHPYPGAHTYLRGAKVIIWKAELCRQPVPSTALGLQPGIVSAVSQQGIDVGTGDGYLRVKTLATDGDTQITVGSRLGGDL